MASRWILPVAQLGPRPAAREVDRFARLEIAVLPGPIRAKGPRSEGWRSMPVGETWELARAAIARGPTNLLVRSGPTMDPSRFLTVIDLDGKCPCGHNRGDHRDHVPDDWDADGLACRARGRDDGACPCVRYAGVDPDEALTILRDVLPAAVAITQTARGYHLLFFTTCAVRAGLLPAYGAEVYGDGQAMQIPPSVHPSGRAYRWMQEPDGDLPVVDLAAIGLSPEPKRGASQQPKTSRRRSPSDGTPAPAGVQEEFRRLLESVGVRSAGRADEHHWCPWHADDATRSLHVDWVLAIFWCFGCQAGGGLRALRDRLAPPTCNPKSELRSDQGSQLGGGWPARRAAAQRLADAIEHLGDATRAAKVRGCATRRAAGPASAEWEAFTCPTGDSAPLRPLTPRSCDDQQCPVCMPQRLAADWRVRACDTLPDEIAIVRLTAASGSNGLDDAGYPQRVRARFREFRRAHHVRGGFYGLVLHREAAAWRAELLVATADPARITAGRNFRAETASTNARPDEFLRALQTAYLTEATSWRSPEELRGLRALTHGRRKFQGFGDQFGEGPSGEQAVGRQPTRALHRVSGGSGVAVRSIPLCPRCGAALVGVGRFDPARMQAVRAFDGLVEWRDRGPPPAV